MTRYATDGYPVTEVVASQWCHAEDLFTDETARATYLVEGQAPAAGEIVRLPELGTTMEHIAAEGADIVYEGDIGATIATEVRNAGGFLTVDDLAGFEVEWLDPLSTTYGGVEVFELGPNN